MDEHSGYSMGRVRRVHLVGIGGVGMSGIAELLHNLGYSVSGSDLAESESLCKLRSLGVKVYLQHRAEQVAGCDVLVYSSAIGKENPERAAAYHQQVPTVSRAEMLAELMRFRRGIAVAGTHGKTTTSSLIVSLIADGGLDPSYVIGGRLNATGVGARVGEGSYLVAEADESDRSFLYLQPLIAVLTNIDRDHLEAYAGDYGKLCSAFGEFIRRMPFYGLVIWCADNAALVELAPGRIRPGLSYGLGPSADYRGRLISMEGGRSRFTVRVPGEQQEWELSLGLLGRHNVLNALAALSVAHQLDIPMELIASAMQSFQGISRRCQVHGDLDFDGKRVLLIDDYAHHPCEIESMLEAVHDSWPGHRVVTVFQPHRYTRAQDLFADFVRVLAPLEVLILLPVYPAGEEPIQGADTLALCAHLKDRGHAPVYLEHCDELPDRLPSLVRDGDRLLILGAGDVGRLAGRLKSRFGIPALREASGG